MFMIVSKNLGGYRPKSPERETAHSMQDVSEEFVSKVGGMPRKRRASIEK